MLYRFLQNEEIIVVCYTGLQSFAAQAILSKRGFTNIKNLDGGLEAYLSLWLLFKYNPIFS